MVKFVYVDRVDDFSSLLSCCSLLFRWSFIWLKQVGVLLAQIYLENLPNMHGRTIMKTISLCHLRGSC